MDRTRPPRWIALILLLGVLPYAGCGASTNGPPTTVCTATSQNDSLHEPAPLPFGAHSNATPLDATAVGSSVEPATMIHQVTETSAGPDLAMPILPVEESVWQSRQTVLPSEPYALEADAPTAETTTESAGSAESRETNDALPSFAEQVTLPWAQDSLDTPELQAIVGQADALVRRGFELASRGAVFSARAQFEKTLRVLAEALDATIGVDHHCKSLAAGLVALKECDDFQQRAIDQPLDVAATVQAHRTPILKHDQLQGLSLSAASQRYFSYAQEQLTAAVAGKAPGSLALYGLGRATLAGNSSEVQSVHTNARAITYFQAAMLVDAKNHLAANELGVILARVGRYEQAKTMLEQSLSATPQAETWHNLSVVCLRLGELDLAAKAKAQASAMTGDRDVRSPNVQWLDATTFARTAPASELVPSPATLASQAQSAEKPTASKKSAWRWPLSKDSSRR